MDTTITTSGYIASLDSYIVSQGIEEDDIMISDCRPTVSARIHYVTYLLPPDFKVDRELLYQHRQARLISGFKIEPRYGNEAFVGTEVTLYLRK